MTTPVEIGRGEAQRPRAGSAPLRSVQHRRKAAFVVVAMLWLLAMGFIEPAVGGLGRIALFAAGLALIAGGAVLRVWAAIHVAGRKSLQLVTGGPYAHMRNPLYVGTLAGVAGAALSFGSLSMTALLVTAAFLILNWVIGREEGRLREEFGSSFGEYTRRTPRWLPVRWAPPTVSRTTGSKDARIETLAGNVVRTLAESLLFLIAPIGALAVDYVRQTGWIEPLIRLL